MSSIPKISVIICAYNAQSYLSQTIESVINQTYKDWELILVDDGSTDRTGEITADYIRKGHPIRYHYQKNRGFAHSRNKCLELAQGEWIAVIDHDDICLPGRLESQMAVAEKTQGVDFVLSDSEHFTDDGSIIGRQFDLIDPRSLMLQKGSAAEQLLIQGCFVDSETAFFRKEAAIRMGGFDTRYRYLTDYDFFLRMGLRTDFAVIDEVLSRWRVHPRQLSQTARETIIVEHCRLFDEWSRRAGLSPASRRAASMRAGIFRLRAFSFYLKLGSPREAFRYLMPLFNLRHLGWLGEARWIRRRFLGRATLP